MSHLNSVYSVWNNNAEAMAQAIGEPGVKVRQWRNRNSIPPMYWPRIIDAAAGLGQTIRLDQFLPVDVQLDNSATTTPSSGNGPELTDAREAA